MELLYLDDMNIREFESEVLSVKDNKFVVLDKTAFYPKSGGVDCDTGKFIRISDGKEFPVVYVGKFGEDVSHEVAEEGLKEGDKIKGVLNWERRQELERYHTAAHVISGIFFKEGDVKVTGNNLTIGKGRVDFNFPNFDRSVIEKLVERANEIIKQNYHVESYYLDRSELDKDPDLIKLAMGIPSGIKTVRIVDIKGFDRQPDAGCHVDKTSEIGKINITKIENRGKNTRRLYFKLE